MTGRRCPCCYSAWWGTVIDISELPNLVVAHRCGECGYYDALAQPRSLAEDAKLALGSDAASGENPCK